jgi:hypothetical protein
MLLWLSSLLVLTTNAEESLRFITIGDWGKPGNIQNAVAQQMASSAEQYNISFIISTGDNFYEVKARDHFHPFLIF